MKRTIIINLLLLIMTACEIIPPAERYVSTTLESARASLLVEFTGLQCVNCPAAAITAQELQQAMGDQLVVVAMHPASNPFTKAKAQYDYTCAEADTYYQFCGGEPTTAFPTGVVNFSADAHGTYLVDKDSWGVQLAAANAETPQCFIELQSSTEQNLNVKLANITTESQEWQVVCWLVEDSVQGAQLMPDGSTNTAYMHRHMLRACVSPIWGDTVHVLPAGEVEHQFTLPALPYKVQRKEYCLWVVLVMKDRIVKNVKQIKF